MKIYEKVVSLTEFSRETKKFRVRHILFGITIMDITYFHYPISTERYEYVIGNLLISEQRDGEPKIGKLKNSV